MKNIKNIDLMDKKTLIKYYITYGGLFSFIGYMLFKNIFISLLFCSISIFYRKEYERTVSQKNKERLLEEFKDFLYSISTSISAGRQMENAIYDARDNLQLIYDNDSEILSEIQKIINGMEESKLPCHILLREFAERSGLDEIRSFYDVYITCRSTGGDIDRAIMKTCEILVNKTVLKRELKKTLAQKKYESKILIILPLIIIVILNLVSPDYLAPLYDTLTGRIVMTTALSGMAISWFINKKITEIRI